VERFKQVLGERVADVRAIVEDPQILKFAHKSVAIY
jgi:hypothetical protein